MSKERERVMRNTEKTGRDRDRAVLFLKLAAKLGVMNMPCL